MGKKLAIRGHSTRGKEAIKLLEMLGGKNNYDSLADNLALCYLIDDEFDICAQYFGYDDYEDGELIIFTLEDFLEKYPFKIGDKIIDTADGCPGIVEKMKWDEDVSDMKYYVAFGNGIDFGWFTNDSIEFCEENKNLEENKFPSFEPMFKLNDELEYKIPDGYEITEVSKNTIFIKPIKPKYPTTYEECCDKTNFKGGFKEMLLSDDEYSLYISFIKLKRCRDAYWKIAGDEMGLDKPWEPDLENEELYCIQNYNKQITISRTNTAFNKILIFPFEEMRDVFFENFKDLIEQCKELL